MSRRRRAFSAVLCTAFALIASAEEAPGASTPVVRVVDGAGRPVQAITVHRAQNLFGRYVEMNVEHVVPAPSVAALEMRSVTGEFAVPIGSLVWGEGTCRRLVSLGLRSAAEPWTLELTPARSLTLRIRRGDGGSAEGLYVVPTRRYGVPDAYYPPPDGAPRTDGRGEVVFDGLPPGAYAFAVLRDDRFHPLLGYAYGRISSKRNEVVEVDVGPWPADSGEAILDQYARSSGNPDLDGWVSEYRDRKDVRRALHRRLTTLGFAVDPSIRRYIGLAVAWRDCTALPLLKVIVAAGDDAGTEFGYLDSYVAAIADIGGGKTVSYLADVARNRELPPSARRAAVMGLIRMDTRKSFAAWKAVREDSRGLPGAPPAQAVYTHAERMAETMTFVLSVIPGEELAGPIDTGGAYVDGDYTGGYIEVGRGRYTMRRTGDEWLPEGSFITSDGVNIAVGRL